MFFFLSYEGILLCIHISFFLLIYLLFLSKEKEGTVYVGIVDILIAKDYTEILINVKETCGKYLLLLYTLSLSNNIIL